MSKGSKQRPAKVPITDKEWDRLFKKEDEEEYQLEEKLTWEDVSHEHWT